MNRPPGSDWAHPVDAGKMRTARKDGMDKMETAGERPVETKGETLNEETGKFNPGDHDDRVGGSGVCDYHGDGYYK